MRSINLASVDLNLLVAFEAIFTTGSVTAAARQLHIGQPAMSAALGRLRSLLDDELFIRIGRDMQPTAKALALAPEIAAALSQIRRTLAASRAFDPATTERALAIAASDYASLVILPGLLAYCCRQAPGIDLRLFSLDKTEVEAQLEQQAIAVALGTFQTPPRQTRQVPLIQEYFVGICRPHHPAITGQTISLEAFAALPQALFTLSRDDTGAIDTALAEQGLERRVILTTPYLLTLPAIIAASDTIAVVPSRVAQHFADQGLVEAFQLPLELPPWSISMLWSRLSDQDHACSWLRDRIQDTCRELPA